MAGHASPENKRLAAMELPGFLTQVLDRLRKNGHSAYLVGGAIRDACLKRPVTDWDVVTSASKPEIHELFSDTRQFSLRHDTVTLVDNRASYEVTPFRGNQGTGDLETDLGHRDLTINAMAYDRESEFLIDPYGGREDLKKKSIRAVGDPGDRFAEDPLRLLRAVRLAGELNFTIEKETLKAISRMSARLHDTARERIRDELVKILISPRPSQGFRLMQRTGLLEVILPELLAGYRKRQNKHHRFTVYRHILETIDATEPGILLRLTALFHDIAKPWVRTKTKGAWRFIGHEKESAAMTREIMKRLRFSNDEIGEVSLLVQHHMINYDSSWTDGAVRRLVRRVGPELIHDLLSFRKADLAARGRGDDGHEILEELEARIERILQDQTAGINRVLAINGYQAMEILGIGPGPALGKILHDLLERVMDHPELNNEKDLIRILREEKGAK